MYSAVSLMSLGAVLSWLLHSAGALYRSVLLLYMFSVYVSCYFSFFFSSRRRHTRCLSDWSSDVCSSDLRKRQPLLRQKLKSHLRRMSSSPANSTRVWIRFARSTLTRSLCSPTSLKQWENCNGNSSAEAPALVALTCTAPRSNTICERCTGTSCSVVVAESANASDSNRAGFSRIRCNNSDGLVCVDSFSGEKPAIFGCASS